MDRDTHKIASKTKCFGGYKGFESKSDCNRDGYGEIKEIIEKRIYEAFAILAKGDTSQNIGNEIDKCQSGEKKKQKQSKLDRFTENNCRNDDSLLKVLLENDFINPSRLRPIKTSIFCGHLNLSNEVAIIERNYEKPNDHFHYPIDSMLRLIPFQRLKQIKYHTTLDARLNNDGCAGDLGFTRENGHYNIPARRTINHFLNNKLGNEGLEKVQKSLIHRLKKEFERYGIKLGRRISVDSMPLKTLRNDSIGSINKYYFQKYGIGSMVKVHFAICVDTGIPLALLVTDANAYDGHYLTPLLVKLRQLGIDFEEVYGDNHYGTLENWARFSVVFGVKCYFYLPKDAVFRKDGTEEAIEERYKKLLEENGDMPSFDGLDFKRKCEYLIERGIYEPVGSYHRNKWWKVRRYDETEYERIYHRRNASEGLHGILKDQLLIDKNINVKGFDDIEFYARQFLVTLLFTALTRVENGISEGLTKINPTAFN